MSITSEELAQRARESGWVYNEEEETWWRGSLGFGGRGCEIKHPGETFRQTLADSPGRCHECNGWIETGYSFESMERHGACFDCSFWLDYVATVDDSTHVIVNGYHHVACNELTGGMRGFGGRRFAIRFNDGRELVSTNLWEQGQVPEHFRDRLPDNAVFVPQRHTPFVL